MLNDTGVTTKEVNLTITNDCIDSSISQYFEFFKNEKTFCAKSSEGNKMT